MSLLTKLEAGTSVPSEISIKNHLPSRTPITFQLAPNNAGSSQSFLFQLSMVSFRYREKLEIQRKSRLFDLSAKSYIEKASNKPVGAPAIDALPNFEFIYRANENKDCSRVPRIESTSHQNDKSDFNCTCLSPLGCSFTSTVRKSRIHASTPDLCCQKHATIVLDS